MARVRPFRAYRYAHRSADITDLTSPPYDVISDEQREELLARDPHNIVALELPEGPADPMAEDNRYRVGATRWQAWRDEGVLVRDEQPAVYVLEQSFEHAGRTVRRSAFIVAVGLEPFEAGVILPHERTLPKALGDRFNLTRACSANFSQVFGLYPDPDRTTSALFAQATSGEPAMTATDDDGVLSRLWVVEDPDFHQRLEGALADTQVFIADGHHRYTTALAYRDERRDNDGSAGDAGFVMMALANMDDPDLLVLPTHRVARVPADFGREEFYAALRERFVVEDLLEGHPDGALDGACAPTFLVKAPGDDRPRRITLRDDVDLDMAIAADHSRAWKELDVAVVQELVLAPILDIHPDRAETLDRLRFVKDPHAALESTGDGCVAFVMRPTRMDQMRAVALAGEIMPQKSTYFYPKLLSGLVVRGID